MQKTPIKVRNTLTCLKLVNPVLLEKGVMIPIACKDLNLYLEVLEYTWCMWTQGLEYTLPMLFFYLCKITKAMYTVLFSS